MTLETTAQKLADAQTKYHKLQTGALRVVVRDGDSTVEYTPANKQDLQNYIKELEAQQAQEIGSSSRPKRAPAGVIW